MSRLVLASKSPRRSALLRHIVPDFEVFSADVNEMAPRALSVGDAVQVIARKKALAVSKERPGSWVLAADTVVSYGEALVGKARDESQARARLAMLAGATHRVWTGVALAYDERAVDVSQAVTAVHMDRLPIAVLDTYITDGHWEGKAGGYGIQDALLAPFIHIKSGPWSNVVGLPMALTTDLLRRNGIKAQDPPTEDWLRENAVSLFSS